MRLTGPLPVLLLAACGPLLLGGCRSWREAACHKPQPYMTARTSGPLRIPDGLSTPDTTGALKLPALNEPAPPPRTGKQPCLDEPPSFKVPKAPPTPQA